MERASERARSGAGGRGRVDALREAWDQREWRQCEAGKARGDRENGGVRRAEAGGG